MLPVPLVVGHGHGADAGVAARVGEQLLEVVDLPDRHDAAVTARQQILAVTTQQHRLGKKRHFNRRWKYVTRLRLLLLIFICYLNFNTQRGNNMAAEKWNHVHKLSPSRPVDLGPVYLLCQSKAQTARSGDPTEDLRSVPSLLRGPSAHRP